MLGTALRKPWYLKQCEWSYAHSQIRFFHHVIQSVAKSVNSGNSNLALAVVVVNSGHPLS